MNRSPLFKTQFLIHVQLLCVFVYLFPKKWTGQNVDIYLRKQRKASLDNIPRTKALIIEFLNSLNFLNTFTTSEKKNVSQTIYHSDILLQLTRKNISRIFFFKLFTEFLFFRLYLELCYLKTFLQTLMLQFCLIIISINFIFFMLQYYKKAYTKRKTFSLF